MTKGRSGGSNMLGGSGVEGHQNPCQHPMPQEEEEEENEDDIDSQKSDKHTRHGEG
jgi:hypothetical protein